jgi:hypothetical protein
MAISIPQAQTILLAGGNYSRGERKQDIGDELAETDAAIIRAAARFVQDAKDNLIKSDSVSSGTLEKSIVPKVKEWGNGVNIIQIMVADYYKFVDKGVKGWKDNKGSGSKYQFKRGSGSKGGNPASNPFIVSIRKWLIRESRAFKNTKVAVTAREQKRAKITDTSTREAMKIAYFVKKGGLRRTGFWTDALAELEKDIATGVADALRIDVIETFK